MECSKANNLIDSLKNQGVKLVLNNGNLKIQAEPGILTDSIINNIRQHKKMLIDSLEYSKMQVSLASFAQQRLWFVDAMEPNNTAYHLPELLKLDGPLNIAYLEESIKIIRSRHQVLNCNFFTDNGDVYQKQRIKKEFTLSRHQVENQCSDECLSSYIKACVAKELERPFDLKNDTLLRAILFIVDTNEHWLFLNIHHIVADGWSIGIFVTELTKIYSDLNNDTPVTLPPLSLQYTDYARWQRSEISQQEQQQQLLYWQENLTGYQPLALPMSYGRPAVKGYQGETERFTFSSKQIKQLKTLTKKYDVTPYMVLISLFYIVLHRFSQQDDIVIGTSIANRNQIEVEGLIGFFVNILALRQKLTSKQRFVDLLMQIKQSTMEAHDYQDVPFEKIVDAVDKTRDLSKTPLFQVAFTMENTPEATLSLADLTISTIPLPTKSAKYDLTMNISCYGDNFSGDLEYSTDLFSKSAISTLLSSYLHLLDEVSLDPTQSIGHYPLMSPQKIDTVFMLGKGKKRAESVGDLVTLFEQQVKKSPNHIALSIQMSSTNGDVKHFSYQQLNQKVNQLADYLREQGIQPGEYVVVCISRSWELIYTTLAVLKIGGAYIPIDPAYPIERKNYILKHSAASTFIVCENDVHVTNNSVRVINLSNISEQLKKHKIDDLHLSIAKDSLAYVIYTSGSTGTPKGVMIEHHSAVNLQCAQQELFNLSSQDNVLQFAPCAFDAFVWELLMSIFSGSTLCIPLPETVKSCHTLEKFIIDNDINIATLPPIMLAELNAVALPKLGQVISAGEACSYRVMAKWHKKRKFYNAYGPTESTVCTTVYLCDGTEQQAPPIGKTLLNLGVFILDKNLQPLPIGVPGEMYLSGAGLARGYLNDEALTSSYFCSVSWHKQRLYKTGDLAFLNSSGNFVYLGRSDSQIKINGFRIELSEVEQVLQQHQLIKDAVVFVKEKSKNKQLVAFIIPEEPSIPIVTLKESLSQKLPQYMLPSSFYKLTTFPLTPNGKVDRKALQKLACQTPSEQPLILAKNHIEQSLVTIFSQVLNIKNVSVVDNFFELGGHSFLALQLLNRINDAFTCQLPISRLFSAPTVAQLAIELTTKNSGVIGMLIVDDFQHTLIKLNTYSEGEPLYLIAGMGGSVLSFYALVQALNYQGPVYGLQPPTLNGGSENLKLMSMLEHAQHYLAAIKHIQPSGPYHIVGHSFGAYIAYEIGLQLEALEEYNNVITVLDTPAPTENVIKASTLTDLELEYAGMEILFMFTGKPLPLSKQEFDEMDDGLRHQRISTLLSDSQISIDTKQSKEFLNIYVRQAKIDYHPHHSLKNSSLTLITADESRENNISSVKQSDELWLSFSEKPISVLSVSGDHLSMLHQPQVEELSRIILNITTTKCSGVIPDLISKEA
ncbi:MAG: amino acid adenylation domain-containing protein [Alteromonadaceae bacterium]|jgi:amino acid adenylation domain-containing protein